MVEHESVRNLAALERLPVPPAALPGTRRPLGMGLWTFTAPVASDVFNKPNVFPVTLYPPRQCHSQPNVLSIVSHCGVSTKYRSKIMAGSKNATSKQGDSGSNGVFFGDRKRTATVQGTDDNRRVRSVSLKQKAGQTTPTHISSLDK
jgi:hypothetical protein